MKWTRTADQQPAAGQVVLACSPLQGYAGLRVVRYTHYVVRSDFDFPMHWCIPVGENGTRKRMPELWTPIAMPEGVTA